MLTAVVLFAVVTQLTSAYDNNEHNDVIKNSARTGSDRVLIEVLLKLSKLEAAMGKSAQQESVVQLQNDVARLRNSSVQLQKDMAVVKYRTSEQNQPKAKVCPADFVRIAAVNGCYKVVTDKLEWPVAQLRCKSLHKDAHLVFVNDAKEQYYLAKFSAHLGISQYWLGTQRIDPSSRSTFVWKTFPTDGYLEATTDDMLEMKYTNWCSGEPNYYKSAEACAFYHSPCNGWADITCLHKFPSVCEIDL